MLNTHYDITRGQEQSSVLVTQRLAGFCQPHDTVVLTGDLNAPPSAPAVQYLTSHDKLYEALTAAGAGGPTWIGQSFSNQLTDCKMDYIFARRDPFTCLQGGRVITDLFGGFSVSDHAAVMAEFCLGKQCSGCK